MTGRNDEQKCGYVRYGWQQTGQNGGRPCRLLLAGESVVVLSRAELYARARAAGLRVLFYQEAGVYRLVAEAEYRTVMRGIWREAKQEQQKLRRELPVADYSNYTLQAAGGAAPGPEEIVLQREQSRLLRAALAELAPLDARIISLFLARQSEAKIAAQVGLSQKGVNKRKQKIFARLREALGENHHCIDGKPLV